GWFNKEAGPIYCAPSCHCLPPVCEALIDEPQHALMLSSGDQWAEIASRVRAGPDLELVGVVGQTVHHLIEDGSMSVQPRPRHANLTGVNKNAPGSLLCRVSDVCIVQHDDWGLAAQFQGDALKR